MTEKGTPKRDGSGMGERANYNRGGCHDGEVCEIGDVIRRDKLHIRRPFYNEYMKCTVMISSYCLHRTFECLFNWIGYINT